MSSILKALQRLESEKDAAPAPPSRADVPVAQAGQPLVRGRRSLPLGWLPFAALGIGAFAGFLWWLSPADENQNVAARGPDPVREQRLAQRPQAERQARAVPPRPALAPPPTAAAAPPSGELKPPSGWPEGVPLELPPPGADEPPPSRVPAVAAERPATPPPAQAPPQFTRSAPAPVAEPAAPPPARSAAPSRPEAESAPRVAPASPPSGNLAAAPPALEVAVTAPSSRRPAPDAEPSRRLAAAPPPASTIAAASPPSAPPSRPAAPPPAERPAAKPAPAPEPVLAESAPPSRAEPAPAPPPRVASLPPPPQMVVESTRWHPTSEKRTARVRLQGRKDPLELREGDAVGVLVVSEIQPSGVVFLHGGREIRRGVGEGR